MTPAPNATITIIFKNGVQLSGIVISWSDQKSVLKSLVGKQTIVIQDTLHDILFFKFSDGDIQTQYEEVVQKPTKTHTDIRELADLKNELNELEREEIAAKLKSHEASGEIKTNYGSLPIAAFKFSEQHSSTQSRSQGVRISSELSNLFSKKD